MVGSLRAAGVMALMSMAVALAPMFIGIVYAIWPSEARLSLMRPISLAGIFASLAGFCGGMINQFVHMGNTGLSPADNRIFYFGLAESIVPLFVGFGCLTVGWLCVALGLRRQTT